MEILRQIGDFEIQVDSAEPCGIALDERGVAALGLRQSATKRDILRLLSSGDEYRPLTLAWEILDSCNFTCPFCYIVGHSNNKVVRLEGIKDHLSNLIDAGVLFCTLTGGEATIHPDFLEIYEYLKMRGVIVEVFTNGYNISDATIDVFKRLPPADVEVSIYTLDSRRLSEIYGVRRPGGAEQVLENVLRLRDSGINVTCKTFLNTVTLEDIESVEQWCAQNNLDHYSSSDVFAAYDGENLNTYSVSRSKVGKAAPVKTTVCLPCGTKNYGSAINSAFQINPCPSIRLKDCLYDIRSLGVPEALNQMKEFMRRFQDTPIRGPTGKNCATCIAFAVPVRDLAGDIQYFQHPTVSSASRPE